MVSNRSVLVLRGVGLHQGPFTWKELLSLEDPISTVCRRRGHLVPSCTDLQPSLLQLENECEATRKRITSKAEAMVLSAQESPQVGQFLLILLASV